MGSTNGITTGSIRVILVDDHELVRQGVRKLLSTNTSIKIVGEAATHFEAISLIGQLVPDVVLLDIRLGEGNGMDVARFIKTNMPEVRILILTAHDDEQYVRTMARIGVSGYLIKTISAKQLIRAIHDVAEGGLVFPPDISTKVVRLIQNNDRKNEFELHGNRKGRNKPEDVLSQNSGFTNREAEVFEHIACGLRNSEVANNMGIAVKTVETHMRHILRKVGASNRTQAVLYTNMSRWQ